MKKSLIALLVVVALVISVSAFSVSAEDTAVAPANEPAPASADYTLTITDGVATAVCPCSEHKGATATFTVCTAMPTTAGHFYLADDINTTSQTAFPKACAVVLHLNGHTYKRTNKGAAIASHQDAIITILDNPANEGSIQNMGTNGANAYNGTGGVITLGNPRTTLNIYGGTYTNFETTAKVTGGIIGSSQATNTINIYGGVFEGGSTVTTDGKGGAFGLTAGTLNIYGGTIQNCQAFNGGSIYATGADSEVNIYGGTIKDGTCKDRGGNITLSGSAKATISGGTITGGTVTGGIYCGGNVYAENGCLVTVNDGALITKGKITTAGSYGGGNIGLRGTGQMVMNGGTISEGSHAGKGGNIFKENGGKVTLNGGTITAGIAGNGANVYAIASAEANRPTVEIKGANITDGNASSGTCGGVYISGNATLTMTAGSITGGTSKYGGGNIRTNGAACIVNISGGSVENGTVTAGDGGNLFSNTAATINITGGSFIGGTASGSGANICLTAANAASVMKNATISGGTTSGTSKTLGATLYLSATIAEISDMTFVGGKAMGSSANAGGVLLASGSNTIKNSTFTGGSAYGNGGALCITTSGTTTLENCTITGGIARYGANLYVSNGTVNLVKTTISKCGTGTLIYGGGVCVNGANAIVNMDADSVITNNNVMHGGNVAVQAGTFNLNGGTISAGKATRNSTTAPYGGNVLVNGGTFNMNSGTITGGVVQNTTADIGGNGGNVYVLAGEFILNDGTITEGAPGSAAALKGPMNGGNVYVAGGKFTMNGGTVSEGTAKNSGGNFAIDAAEATLDINGGSIEGGEAPSGGSFWINNGTVTVDNATIDGGSATIGGNITFNGGSAAFTNCDILNGASTGNGGNIAVNGEGATFTGCEILNGVAGTKVVDQETGAIAKPSTDGRGGNLAIGANTTLTNCVIRNGESWSVSNPGGGNIYAVTGDNIILDGCTITGGICYSIGGNICLHGITTVMTIKGDSYIQGGVSTNNWGGNIGYSNTATLKLEGDTVVDGKESRCHNNAQYGNNIGFSAAGKLYVSGNAKVINGDNQYQGTTLGGNRWSVAVVAATATAVPKIYFAENGSIDSIFLRGTNAVGCDGIIVLQEGWTGATQVRTNFATYNNSVAPGEAVYAAVTKEAGYTGTGSLKVTKGSGVGTGYITFVDTADSILKVAGITGFKVYNKGAENEYTVENGFGSLDAVVDAGYDYAKLYTNGTYDLTAKTDNFPIDMNNCVVTFNTNGYKLAAIDYRTDGHVVAKYTKITVDNDDNVVLLTQNPVNGYQYLNVKGDDGTWTSNRVQVELTKVSIKTTKDGIYYTTKISANAIAATALVDYGTAVSLLEMPTADFLDHLDTNGAMYTAFDLNKTGDFSIEARSALVTGILSDGEDAATNTARAQMKIYANSFVTAMVDGKEVKIMADETSELSFEDIMVKLDNKIVELNQKQPEGYEKTIETAVEFYNKWEDIFSTWKDNADKDLLPNLKAAAAA